MPHSHSISLFSSFCLSSFSFFSIGSFFCPHLFFVRHVFLYITFFMWGNHIAFSLNTFNLFSPFDKKKKIHVYIDKQNCFHHQYTRLNPILLRNMTDPAIIVRNIKCKWRLYMKTRELVRKHKRLIIVIIQVAKIHKPLSLIKLYYTTHHHSWVHSHLYDHKNLIIT